MNKIVALHGNPGAGKDTVSAHLGSVWGYRKFAFANYVYREVAAMFDVPEDLLRRRDVKEEPQQELAYFHASNPEYRDFLKAHKCGMYDPQTSRFHLRHFGTEFQKKLGDPSRWAKLLVQEVKSLPEDTDIVVSDLRTYDDLHEYKELEKLATMTSRELIVIEVLREGSKGSAHSSDKRLPQPLITVTIHNHEGAPEHTLKSVEEFLGLGDTQF